MASSRREARRTHSFTVNLFNGNNILISSVRMVRGSTKTISTPATMNSYKKVILTEQQLESTQEHALDNAR